jgi:hypothetical protein
LRAFQSTVDTSCIATFPEALTVKVFMNNKFLYLDIENNTGDYSLEYVPTATRLLVWASTINGLVFRLIIKS